MAVLGQFKKFLRSGKKGKRGAYGVVRKMNGIRTTQDTA
jgi:hypothetical protein